ncbi:MAG: glycosyltransferase family 2 protein [Candidatus Solibacter sp.]
MTATMEKSWQVPAYETHEFRPRGSRYSIGIPVINEGSRITGQLERMAKLQLPADVIIGDGGSKDGSTDPEIMQRLGVRTLLVKTGPGKLSAQLRMLFAYSILQGYEGMVTLDGNGKDGVEAIPAFLRALEEGYGFVQGSRFLPGGGEHNTPLERKLGAMLIHVPVISLAARFRYTDTTNGFRAFSTRFLTDPAVQPFRDVFDTYNLHYYLSIKAPRLGYRVKELPVVRTYPVSGPVPSKIGGMSGKLEIIKLLLLSAIGHYDLPG